MATAPIYSGDQPFLNNAIVNGVTTVASSALLDSLPLPGGAVNYAFTADWTQVYNGQVLSFLVSVSYPIDPPLLAALNAAGAPIVAV